jgi:hypothetical protein
MKRGTEQQMKDVQKILVGTGDYDPAHPHYDGQKPSWPTKRAIDQCIDQG